MRITKATLEARVAELEQQLETERTAFAMLKSDNRRERKLLGVVELAHDFVRSLQQSITVSGFFEPRNVIRVDMWRRHELNRLRRRCAAVTRDN